jgi:hypothetical protein
MTTKILMSEVKTSGTQRGTLEGRSAKKEGVNKVFMREVMNGMLHRWL